MGDIFWGLLKFQIYLGVLEIPNIFGFNGRCYEPTYEEKSRVPRGIQRGLRGLLNNPHP